MCRVLGGLGLALLLAGCAGQSEFRSCVDHSVQEGVRQEAAEQACERAVGRE